MASCAFCTKPAVASIPANDGRVCLAHAIEFWTAFLAYAKDHRPDLPLEDPAPGADQSDPRHTSQCAAARRRRPGSKPTASAARARLEHRAHHRVAAVKRTA